MRTRSSIMFARTTKALCAVLLLAVVVSVLGCGSGPFGLATEEDDKRIADEKAWDEKMADGAAKEPTSEGTTDGAVMKYEDNGSDPLVGGWSYLGMDYTPANKQWGKGKLGPDTELFTVTFVKQGEIYSLQGSSDFTVTFDGANVTITGGPAGSLQSKFSGILKGDTITGTRHHVGGKLVYDGPWTATRAK